MSSRILGPALCAGLLALTTVIYAQYTPQTTANSDLTLAQATTSPVMADAPAKTKNKVKKAKRSKGSGNGGAEHRPAAPAASPGPPDPAKY